jgi:tRNA threonylcarbamoyladenosine biosynthesis protein TsaB
MSAYLLAVDTTSDLGSIALAETTNVMEELAVDSAGGYAHVLFDEILRLLARHDLTLADVDCFASASGPGSFTGVRVGLTAVMGLAEANRRKVAAVSNLQALASFGTRPLRAPVIDARRGEIYGAVYDADLRLVQEETVTPLDSWIANLPQGDLQIVTAGLALAAQPHPVIEAPRVLAGAIARIAARDFLEGLVKDPAEIDANYVRRSDAELFWRDPITRK